VRRYILTLLLLVGVCSNICAQFKTATKTGSGSGVISGPPGSNTTGTNSESEVSADTTGGISFKKLFRGLSHKDSLTPSYLFLGSVIMPGSAQIYNRDYWKLPLFYGGLGSTIYFGIQNNQKYQQTGEQKYANYRTYCYLSAGLIYWSSIMDGVISFNSDKKPDPGKSTLYSALLPGLGQAYNGDYWKIPIWYGGFVACGYFFHMNDIQYKRFKYIYIMANDSESGYKGHITASQAEWYRDQYRRYRDYSVIAIVLVYALNIIDANVFAYMSDFDVSDDLSFNVQPTIVNPINTNFAAVNNNPAFGFQMQLNF
jgi:hypothetical protein